MKEQGKKKYEVPSMELVQVEMESGLCAVSVHTGEDVGEDRHVEINKQTDGGSIDFSGNTWE